MVQSGSFLFTEMAAEKFRVGTMTCPTSQTIVAEPDPLLITITNNTTEPCVPSKLSKYFTCINFTFTTKPCYEVRFVVFPILKMEKTETGGSKDNSIESRFKLSPWDLEPTLLATIISFLT